MRIIALVIFVVIAAMFLLRPILAKVPELEEFRQRVETDNLSFVTRARVLFKGIKTKLFGRALMLAGVLAPLLQVFNVVDFTAILPPVDLGFIGIAQTIPATVYVPAVLLPLIGKVVNFLRSVSDGPVGENTFVLEPEKIGIASAPSAPPSPDEIAAARATLARAGVPAAPVLAISSDLLLDGTLTAKPSFTG